MTAVKKVSRNALAQISGLPQPGYADSETNTIYIANDLDKEAEGIVLEHEKQHIAKGESGGFWGAVISAAGSLLGGAASNNAAQNMQDVNAQTAENASQRQMEMQRRSMEELQRQYELARRDTLAGRITGINAMNFLNQALLPGYGGFVNPDIAFTPDYLQPTRYNTDGGVEIMPGEDLRGQHYKTHTNPIEAAKLSLKPDDNIKDMFAGLGVRTDPTTISEYAPSEGQLISNYDGGQSYVTGASNPNTRNISGLVDNARTPSFAARTGRAAPQGNTYDQQGNPVPTAGTSFLPQAFDPGEFEASPGYQFRMDEGAKGVQNYLGKNKMRLSGAALKAMEKYRQGFASNEYGNWFGRQLSTHQQTEQDKQNYLSRVFQMAGYGPQSVNTAATAGANTASGVANVNSNVGNALSNIAMQGGANAANIYGQNAANQNNAIQSGVNNYLAYSAQNQNYGGNTGGNNRNTFYRGDVWGNPY